MFRRRVPLRALSGLAVLAALVPALLTGCGGDDHASAPAGCTPVVGNKVTLVARNIAWDKTCLKVKAGTTVTFTVRLEDQGVKHDLQVFGHGQKQKTPLEAGPKTQKLVFTFTDPGYYQYVCTIHSTMEGAIYAI